ncbi:uncharacterized protein TM35_000043340 [Trypanosoma theileri]|uniref:Uncharacterized protein n=1 Tax=Trypanosoma theileri TaxID=67003 RepID=A0A1X0P6R1_9TRYP|nr:uncharacterized protein TM35_000043340 [Trypanosoma theileri]ORC92120.1 hypothetical protein TM35_000043340 [Trypanosoma theileri]
MLRICLRRFCCMKLFNAGGANVENISTSTPCEGTAPLEWQIQPFVPMTFTALTQISRSVDVDLMEKVAEAGGLRTLLIRHPELFSVSKVGSVYVARRLQKGRKEHKTSFKSDAKHKKRQDKDMISSHHVKSYPVAKRPPLEVFCLFPTFFIPVDALITYVREIRMAGSEEKKSNTRWISMSEDFGSPEEFVRKKMKEYDDFIEVVSINETSSSNVSDGDNSGDKIVRHCFVRLRTSLVEFAKQNEEALEKEEDGTCGDALHIDNVMELYEVPQYEQYRAARLIDIVEEFVPISQEMQQEASLLLTEGRSLIHVFVSAPHLFEIRDSPELSVRFLLDPKYKPSITHTKDEIAHKLEEIREGALKNGLRMPIDRRKRRMLSRQLQFLTKPTPYFDEAVLAHAVVDVLPLDGPVSVAHLMPKLPKECVNCMPSALGRLFNHFPHLFRVFDGEREMLVQRADIPAPEQRRISTIQSDEILLVLYNAYPRRRHPNSGTCLHRCLHNLPLRVRLRIRQLDFLEDVLRKHPDKVEMLGVDEELMKNCSPSANLQMFHLFRFVGDLQQDLVKRYEALCAKLGVDPDTTTQLV